MYLYSALYNTNCFKAAIVFMMKNNVIKHFQFQLYSSCTEGNSVIIQFKFILILVSVQLNRYYEY